MYMKISLLVLTSATAIAFTACASGPKYAPDPSLTRSKADNAYSQMDGNTAHSSEATPAAFEPAEDLPSFPTIMVIPSETLKDAPFSKAMAETINGYLTQRHYEVKSVEGGSQLDAVIRMQNDIASTEDDMSYLASLALGADIYLKFNGNVQTDNITVELNAYETSTARLLGSQTAEVKNNGHTDQANIRANAQSAVRKAMSGLEQKIRSYWKADLVKGQQYKVIMNLKGEYTDGQVEELQDAVSKFMKSSFNSIVINVMTEKTIDMTVYADPAKFADSQEVYSHIRNQLKSHAEAKKLNITKKLILMDIL